MKRGRGTRLLLVPLAIGLFALTQQASARLSPPVSAAVRTPLPCTPAAAARLHLKGAPIDRIEVYTAPWSPPEAASEVRVETTDSERRLGIRDNASSRLSFHPPLRGQVIDVSIDPVFSARAPACIERIELWGRGVRLAVVHP